MFRVALALTLTLAALPAVAQQGYAWAYYRNVSANLLETSLGLSYGVPQSDDMQAWVQCTIGANWIYGDVNLTMDVDGLADGAIVAVQITAPGYSASHDADVIRHEEGIQGVVFAIALDDPLWTAMMGQPALIYSVAGRAPMTLDLTGAAGPVHEFLGDCLSIVDLAPDASVTPSK